jgi:uncharacterized protein (TIGR02453 family)
VATKPHFSRQAFQFFRELKQNNTRDWFAENKSRFEDDVKAPALRLIEDLSPLLHALSPHFTATPRSLFRIYRDTRFGKGKTPYKAAVGIHLRHEQLKDAHGIWRPASPALGQIREYLVEDPARWKRVANGTRFKKVFQLEGDRLKRAPRGFDPDHTMIEDLRRKDFVAVQRTTQTLATGLDLPTELAKTYKAGLPLMRLLCNALAVPF